MLFMWTHKNSPHNREKRTRQHQGDSVREAVWVDWPTKPVKVLDICGFSAPLSRGVVGVTPWIPGFVHDALLTGIVTQVVV